MKKVKVFKFLGQMLITAILASVILTATNWIVGLIAPYSGVFNDFLISLVAVGFFIWAMQINPGKEEFMTTLPIVILAITLVDLIRHWITVIPNLVIPFTWVGLAFGFGSVFLATMVTKKYILK